MENVKKYRKLIVFAINSPVDKRVVLLKSFNLNIIKTICEIFLNILSKVITAPPEVVKQLQKHKQLLYKLADSKIPLSEKKEALIKCKGEVLTPIKKLIP
jgi:hypothetical protein